PQLWRLTNKRRRAGTRLSGQERHNDVVRGDAKIQSTINSLIRSHVSSAGCPRGHTLLAIASHSGAGMPAGIWLTISLSARGPRSPEQPALGSVNTLLPAEGGRESA